MVEADVYRLGFESGLSMTSRRLEEQRVWNAAIELAIRIYDLAESGQMGSLSGLCNQIERAVLSVSNNIAKALKEQRWPN